MKFVSATARLAGTFGTPFRTVVGVAFAAPVRVELYDAAADGLSTEGDTVGRSFELSAVAVDVFPKSRKPKRT